MVEMRLAGEDGAALPHDAKSLGRLQVRGPAVTRAYIGDDHPAIDSDGWFDTGDIATICPLGYMQITDRAKDIIKSGGEWISSIEIESMVSMHPKVSLAAAIGVLHPKWEERPILFLTLKPGEAGDARRDHRIPDRQDGEMVAARRGVFHRRDAAGRHRQDRQEDSARTRPDGPRSIGHWTLIILLVRARTG